MDWIALFKGAGSALRMAWPIVLGGCLTVFGGWFQQRSSSDRAVKQATRVDIRLSLETVILGSQDLCVGMKRAASMLADPHSLVYGALQSSRVDQQDVTQELVAESVDHVRSLIPQLALNSSGEDVDLRSLQLALVRLQLLLPQFGALGPAVERLDVTVKKCVSGIEGLPTTLTIEDDIRVLEQLEGELEDQLGVVINTARRTFALRR